MTRRRFVAFSVAAAAVVGMLLVPSDGGDGSGGSRVDTSVQFTRPGEVHPRDHQPTCDPRLDKGNDEQGHRRCASP